MELFNVAEAAEYLKVSQQRIRQFCAEGRLGQKVGNQWIFTREELERFQAIPRKTGRPVERGEVE